MNHHQLSSALLIIDMQRGSFTRETPRYDAEQVVSRINTLATTFRSRECPVIWIQHDGSRFGEFVPETEQWALLPELQVLPEDWIIPKTANDSFYRSTLENRLNSAGIDTLYITGCATDFCVESTIQSALTRDYEVHVVSDAHTTADRPGIQAQQVIAHYNWVWQNMIPTRGRLHVLSSSEIRL